MKFRKQLFKLVYTFGRKIYSIMYVIESILKTNSMFFHLDTHIEIDVCEMFKIKYGLNRMHSFTFSHQVGQFDGKGINIHPWGSKDQTS